MATTSACFVALLAGAVAAATVAAAANDVNTLSFFHEAQVGGNETRVAVVTVNWCMNIECAPLETRSIKWNGVGAFLKTRDDNRTINVHLWKNVNCIPRDGGDSVVSVSAAAESVQEVDLSVSSFALSQTLPLTQAGDDENRAKCMAGKELQHSLSPSAEPSGTVTETDSAASQAPAAITSPAPQMSNGAPGYTRATASSSSSSSISLVTWILPLVCSVVLLVGLGYWFCRKRHPSIKRHRSDSNVSAMEAPRIHPPPASMDPVLLPLRIAATDVVLSDILGSGANGIVYKATWLTRVVVVKKLKTSSTAPLSTLIDEFVNEITLAATFHHPNIVELLGVIWTRRTDVGAVFEFMAGGPLNNLLYNETHARFLEWHSPRHIVGKRSLAEDIAQALICLHGCQPPVLHRDLKSMNVLLRICERR